MLGSISKVRKHDEQAKELYASVDASQTIDSIYQGYSVPGTSNTGILTEVRRHHDIFVEGDICAHRYQRIGFLQRLKCRRALTSAPLDLPFDDMEH